MTSPKWPNPAAFEDVCEALEKARETIRAWHAISLPKEQQETIWGLYQASPEMKVINAALSRARGEDVSAGRDARREDVK